MRKLIPVLAFTAVFGCKSIPLNYDKIQPGQTLEQVEALLGEPGDKQSGGKREAWQYCETATLSDNFFAVIFEDGTVARTERYKTAGLVGGPCGGFKDVLAASEESPRPEPAPRPSRGETARPAEGGAAAKPGAPKAPLAAPAPLTPPAVPAPERREGAVYTRFNVHAADDVRDGEHSYNACYSGWVAPPGIGHVVLPPNTRVSFMRWRSGFALKEEETGRVIRYEFDPERMRMDAQEYFRQITSEEPVSLEGLSPEDRKGVAEGVVSIGMTKQGVLAAYGIPAKHRTPTLDENVWIYWRNRFRTRAISFDEKGIVRQIQD